MTTQEPLHLAQVGVGYWGKNLLRNFQSLPDVEVVLACDQDDDVCRRVSEQYPELETTGRFDDVLEREEIDAVVIATETPQHYRMARAALEAGKHVFVEKPLAQKREEAEELVQIAEANDRRLMVGHLLLYHPAFRYVEGEIADGTLGEVYYLYSTRVNLGIIRQRENAFESLGPHDLSVALAFLDRRPVAVAAQGHDYLQKGIEDVVFVTIHFEDGRLAHLHTSWLDPHKIRKVTVVGSRRMAVIDDTENVEKVRLYDKGVDLEPGESRFAEYAEAMSLRTGDIRIPKIDMEEPLLSECRHFIECVRSGETPRSDGRNGLAVVELLEAAGKSLENGGGVVELR